MPMIDIKDDQGAVIGQRAMTKAEILTQARDTREDEVLSYQINIDNYTMMIAEIDAMPAPDADSIAFKTHLEGLLASERREQNKAKLVLTVLNKQLL